MSCHDLPSPGGTALIERALALCAFPPGAALADVGCGGGECVRYLNGRTDYRICGIDSDPAAIEKASAPGLDLRCCGAEELPFGEASLDGMIFQCSLSLFKRPREALKSAARALKEGGKIIVADFYSRGTEAKFSRTLGRVERKEKIILRLEEAGFKLLAFEDFTREMRELWGQLILDGGAPEELFGEGAAEKIKAAKCGYGLFVAEKGGRAGNDFRS
ncbi:DVU_1556 family methyltransferase [Synergistes jonesii]|uniref:DVU_1556 family methyltransferase n=1 Tax=Synergistes jonesii TaxID=2754 RepID=UPI00242EB0C6|nr:class I SAM-dependent methyltransferase [Synergistes jonesii]